MFNDVRATVNHATFGELSCCFAGLNTSRDFSFQIRRLKIAINL